MMHSASGCKEEVLVMNTHARFGCGMRRTMRVELACSYFWLVLSYSHVCGSLRRLIFKPSHSQVFKAHSVATLWLLISISSNAVVPWYAGAKVTSIVL